MKIEVGQPLFFELYQPKTKNMYFYFLIRLNSKVGKDKNSELGQLPFSNFTNPWDQIK